VVREGKIENREIGIRELGNSHDLKVGEIASIAPTFRSGIKEINSPDHQVGDQE